MATLTIRAHAKINLDLRLGARRPDGFHHIDTLFVRTDVADQLSASLSPNGSLSLQIEGDEGLSAGPDNLVLRAAQALQEKEGTPPEQTSDSKRRSPKGPASAAEVATRRRPLIYYGTYGHLRYPMRNFPKSGRAWGAISPFSCSPVPPAAPERVRFSNRSTFNPCLGRC
jgi:hypothetical protein